MTEISTSTWNTALERKTTVRTVELVEGVFLYEVGTETRELGNRVKSEAAKTFKQGVVDISNLALVQAGRFDEVVHWQPVEKSSKRYGSTPILFTEAGIEAIRIEGNPMQDGKLWDRLVASGDCVRLHDGSFLDRVEAGARLADIHFISIGEHSLTTIAGHPVPMAMKYGSSVGETISDDRYDLEATVKHLQQNEEITLTPDDRGNLVRRMSYYENGTPNDEYIYFTWVPTRESWAELLRQLGVGEGGERRTRITQRDILVETDFFGLKEAGCVLEQGNHM